MTITASLQEKRGIYQVVLSYKDNMNKRKQKWISTGISVKGNNKRLANKKLEEIKQNYEKYISPTVTKYETKTQLFEVYMKDWLVSYKQKKILMILIVRLLVKLIIIFQVKTLL